MIRSAWRSTVRFLGSAGLALGLLVFAGLWSAVASMIPQTDASGQQAATWAAAHPGIESLVRVFGLQSAFSAPVFIACVALLTLCTALCAWRRTKVALARSRALRSAARLDGASLSATHDLEIDCGPALDRDSVLTLGAAALVEAGLRVEHSEDSIRAVSPVWSVWGSPVFHWALVAFVVVVIVGSLKSSSGLMGLATGQTKPDTPASYGTLTAGALHDWRAVHRSFKVDYFQPDLRVGNLDYGHAPTVSVLDGSGHVIASQLVYPNMPLQLGSLTIHAPAFGLAVTIAMDDQTGAEVARGIQFADFTAAPPDGTTSAGHLTVTDQSGKAEYLVYVTVPLDRVGAGYSETMPAVPSARVSITTVAGKPVADRVLNPGGTVDLPTGGSLMLVSVGWYSRLSIVDDPSVPYLYAVLLIALIGLTTTVFARQQYVVATIVDGPDGVALVLSARFWRNASTSREAIVAALTEALGSAKEGSDS